MTEATTLWEDASRQVAVRLLQRPSPRVVELLGRTIWGGGGLRYRFLDVEARLARLRDPHLFVLDEAGALLAVCVLDRCTKQVGGRRLDAFHFAMIATDECAQGRGYARRVVETAAGFCRQALRRPGLAFAYIEEGTRASLALSDHLGHAIDARLSLVLVSRLAPRTDQRVGLLATAEREALAGRLAALYADHQLGDLDQSLDPSAYHVLRTAEGIAAGVQVEPLRWSVIALTGVVGEALRRILPYMPLPGGHVDPADLAVLRLGHLLAEPGRETALAPLLASVLASHRAHLALLLMDRRSAMLERVRAHGRLGPLGRLLKANVALRVDMVGMDAVDMALLRAAPLLASPADVI